MKKLIAVIAITSLYFTANAQKFYVQGGLNLANITKDNAGNTSDNNVLPTFNAGAMVTFGISSVFDLETGLLFTGKGAKADSYASTDHSDNYIKTKFNPYYIELPLNAQIKFPLSGKKSSIFVTAGPYVSVGVAGKAKTESKILGVETNSSTDIKFNNDDPTQPGQQDASYDKIKRFDYGANFGAGIDFGHFILKAGYGLGLAKINSTQTNNGDNQKNKYRTLSFSIGIPLGK